MPVFIELIYSQFALGLQLCSSSGMLFNNANAARTALPIQAGVLISYTAGRGR